MSDYLRNARDFTLNHSTFSNVAGDQHIHHNHTTTVTTVQTKKSRLWIQGTEEEEGEFEQYYEVKRADVEFTRSICSYRADESRRKRQFDCEKKFFAGEIARGDAQSSGLMVVAYEGQEAREAWLEDFKRVTGLLSVDSAHLLAISRSKIPLMIFTKELVPAKQFLANVGHLGRTYLARLSRQLGCLSRREVWMDPQRGVFCRGPEGPSDEWWYMEGFEDAENVPSSVELLQEDVFRRFLTGFKSAWADDIVVGALDQARRVEDADIEFDQPTVISPLANTPIAASGVSRWRDRSSKKHGDLLANGRTRFTLDDPPAELSLESLHPGRAWLSQAWSIFHAHGLSLQDDLSEFKLIVPHIYLQLSLSQSDLERRRRRQQPIFLFIRPLPSTPLQSRTTSSRHYWSFDKDGRPPFSSYKCRHLGLPVALELKVCCHMACIWSNDVYKTIHEYQVTRGFDPRTTDFARSLGYPTLEPIHDDSDRFEEVAVIEAKTESNQTSAEDEITVPGGHSCSLQQARLLSAEIKGVDSDAQPRVAERGLITIHRDNKQHIFRKIRQWWSRRF